MTPELLRNLVKEVSGKHISSDQATVVLEVFKDSLNDITTKANRDFVELHFGCRKATNSINGI